MEGIRLDYSILNENMRKPSRQRKKNRGAYDYFDKKKLTTKETTHARCAWNFELKH